MKMKSSVKMSDVAKAAGVAVSTASMALRNDLKIKLSTRKKLKKTAEKLGYVPNPAAQALAGGKANAIGIIVPPMLNTIIMEEAIELQKHIEAKQYKVKMFMIDLEKEKHNYFLEIASEHIGGLITYPLTQEWNNLALPRLNMSNIKYIFSKFTDIQDTDWISHNYEKGGYLAADYLLKKGHRNIGVFSGTNYSKKFPEREDGIRRAFAENGIKIDENIFLTYPIYDMSDCYYLAKKLISQRPRPTALFMRSDFVALVAIRAATDAGLKVGKDIDIVGFDNIQQGEFSTPSLTTIGYDRCKKTELLVTTLLRRINGEKFPPVNIFMEPRLIIRETA